MKRERVAHAKFKKEREREEAILREREEREVGGVCGVGEDGGEVGVCVV